MAEIVRYGIVGCAGIGNMHAESVQAVEGATLVACADLDEEAAKSFADEHGDGDITPYTSTSEMIVDADLDAVSVCTPSGTHADVVVECAEAGADILCEKPLDVYAERIDRMITACEEAGVTLAGVFQRRVQPGVHRAKEAIEAGELGSMTLADGSVKWHRSQEYYDQADWRGTREMDGGVLMNQAVHALDTVQWVMGGVERVTAVCETLARDIEVEDTAVATMEFGNGAIGTFEATTTAQPDKPVEFSFLGDEGTVSLSDEIVTEFETNLHDAPDYPSEDEHVAWGDEHTMVVQDFVDALREGREPMVPAREARKAVDLILAIYEAAETGEPVRPASFREA